MAVAVIQKSAAELLGIINQPKNARDRLISKAIDLFYMRGFHAVGLDQIIEEVGTTKTTFYKYFESKDDLIVAAIQKRDEWESQAWARAVGKIAGDDPRKQLLAFFDVLDLWFNDPMYGGCMFINAGAEFPDPNDPVHQAASAHKKKARDNWRDQAKAAGAKDPEAFADLYTAMVEGTLILRHIHDRNDAAKTMRPTIARLIEQFIG